MTQMRAFYPSSTTMGAAVGEPDIERNGRSSTPERGRPEVVGLPCPRCDGGTAVKSTGRSDAVALDYPVSRGVVEFVRAGRLQVMLRRRVCKECGYQRLSVETWMPEGGPGLETYDEDRQWAQAERRRKTDRRIPSKWKPRNYVRIFVESITRSKDT